MENADSSKDDEAVFEKLFKNRFTDNDPVYSELKSKPLQPPTVVYPWRVKKQWNKPWDYSAGRYNRDRNRPRYHDRDHQSSNSYNHYRDRSRDGESSRYRDGNRDNQGSSRRTEDDRGSNRSENRGNFRKNHYRDRD